jgi:hypothetical protein
MRKECSQPLEFAKCWTYLSDEHPLQDPGKASEDI